MLDASPTADGGAVYPARDIKRFRSTKAQVEGRREVLWFLARDHKPCTVRQIFYLATVHGLVEKSESGYDKVQADLILMRKAGRLPYAWITDGTRLRQQLRTFDSVEEAAEETARFYRRNAWRQCGAYAEVWVEKDALSGALFPITSKYDVPLMVARGFSSATYLYGTAEEIREDGRPTFIYHLGDNDPSGYAAGEHIIRTLREMVPGHEIHFERLAVTPEQIERWNLPTRPTKETDSRARRFGGKQSCELDSIPPPRLRQIVEDALNRHLPAERLRVLRATEENERDGMRAAFGRAFYGEGHGDA